MYPLLDQLSFPRLESIDIRFYWNTKREWTEFFEKHQNVSRLVARHGFTLPLMDFTAAMPNLVELTIENTRIFKIDTIAEFFESRPMLMKFQLSGIVDYVESSYLEGIQGRFENDWHFRACDSGFSLERKIKNFK